MTSNRPLRELVAEAKAEVMEEIEDNREEGEEEDAMELTVVPKRLFVLLQLHIKVVRLITLNESSSYFRPGYFYCIYK